MLIKASFIYSAISCLSVILSVICYITFNISGIYEIQFKDGYKGPGNNLHLDRILMVLVQKSNLLRLKTQVVNGLTLVFVISLM